MARSCRLDQPDQPGQIVIANPAQAPDLTAVPQHNLHHGHRDVRGTLRLKSQWCRKFDGQEKSSALWFAKPLLAQIVSPCINLLPPEIVTLRDLRRRCAVPTHLANNGKLLSIRPRTPTLNRTQNITSHAALK